MNILKTILLLAILLPLSNCVMANHDGDGSKETLLSGSVSDALSRKPLKGVTISVTSARDRIEKSFTTDASGRFTIPRMPAGEVTIVLEKKGYKTYRREKVVLKEGKPLKLDFDIRNNKETDDGNLFNPLLRMMES